MTIYGSDFQQVNLTPNGGVSPTEKCSFSDDFLNIFAKKLIVGTRWNRLSEAVLANTHNLCFRAKVRKTRKCVSETLWPQLNACI